MSAPIPLTYPWYSTVTGDEIEQGEILEACPVFFPRTAEHLDDPLSRGYFDWAERDVIVISQSCDIVKGREKNTDVLLCSLWRRCQLPMSANARRETSTFDCFHLTVNTSPKRLLATSCAWACQLTFLPSTNCSPQLCKSEEFWISLYVL
jgi:hypothetical protein